VVEDEAVEDEEVADEEAVEDEEVADEEVEDVELEDEEEGGGESFCATDRINVITTADYARIPIRRRHR